MDKPIMVPDMCKLHQALLVRQAGYGPNDTWRALVIMANVALFQGASADQKVYKEINGKIEDISKLGCLACRKPDLFGQIVEEAKAHELGRIKALGEKWVEEGIK